ncbi:YpfJ protein, zinc metalloprotease superfamily [Rhodovulum sp. PH10]|uniref:KPN_02809 family neutral zinc metallopeptidase n=1 Tax=Rhodovulum sp. PH10 TaxID=1187851 RepID=UPI00027C29CE|nr:neutral zinc metallopeptidase [Rhodovulum sp. PH10]EJW12981.1 YpfJ protein, zinc metalloprotease superfamily [Rhodovulum sp. PH10]
MRWDNLPESDNVEDRRGESGYSRGGFGLPVGGGGLGIGTIVVLGLVGWALGIDPRLLIGGAEMMQGGGQRQVQQQSSGRTGTPDDQTGKFVSAVLGSADVEWKEIFSKNGATYRGPVLVLYNEVTNQACGGVAQAAMGPFYCPADRKVYLDTSFFKDIERRFHGCDAGSDSCRFAQAYVIAHEVGHHVQNLLGILPKVNEMQRGMSRTDANRLQVRVELQADCFAGVWAHHADRKYRAIEPGDVEAAMRTASAIGDDKLQMQARGRVVPDSFTHGSSAQRQRWFETGLKEGTISACNTFKADSL